MAFLSLSERCSVRILNMALTGLNNVFLDVTENMRPWFKWSFGIVATAVVIVLGLVVLLPCLVMVKIDEIIYVVKKTQFWKQTSKLFTSFGKLFFK